MALLDSTSQRGKIAAPIFRGTTSALERRAGFEISTCEMLRP
jgi:hypothetical protein